MSINEIISNYIMAKEQENNAKKTAEQLKQLILNYAGTAEIFETDNFFVTITKRPQTRLDTKTLYKDFPDIKETYGITSYSDIITAKQKQAEQLTA